MTRHKLKEIIYNSTSGSGFIFLVHNQFLQLIIKKQALKIVQKRLGQISHKRRHTGFSNRKKRHLSRLAIREMHIESTVRYKLDWMIY